jgi:prepilin-type N-terminal cleavage/methylation domain-containing protein
MQRPQSNVPGPRPQMPVQFPARQFREDIAAHRPHRGTARHTQRGAERLAFTLLELLIAIAIIAILASLILTVAGGARIKARNAQVSADILSLSTGISAFKQQYGIEPPSRITLYEQGTTTAPSGANSWNSDPRSMGLIRQIWPQFDFSADRDINGDGNATENISLSGAECLVFFLGGVPSLITGTTPGNQGGAPMGFSLNPADPFSRASASNRTNFTTFDLSRLVVYSTQTNRMNTYLDQLAPSPTFSPTSVPSSQPYPYLYLSSYGGQGYDVVNELPSGSLPGGTFADVYRQGPNGATTSSPSPPWNPNSYQIISPGGDQSFPAPNGGYGLGGEYEVGDPKGLLVGSRTAERDNLTNFTSGTLAP